MASALGDKAAVIIVNWNGWADTVACLDSCAGLEYANREIVVVDNGSTNDSVARIRAAQPEIVWVGIGSPRQEMRITVHIDQINVPVLVGVGAAFVFLSGNKRQAPGWVQRSGLEWFYRLVSEPGRLWRRYLLGYPRFVVLVALQALGLLRFE